MERISLGETDVITIKNRHGSCRFTLLGAHLISYIPAGQEEVLWMGSKNSFALDKAIRGGIPICWPRFNLEPLNSEFAKHGFARNEVWSLNNIDEGEDETVVTLSMHQSAATKQQKPFNVALLLRIRLNEKLTLELETLNIGDDEVRFSEALHTYYNVSDIHKIKILGLQNSQYFDRINNNELLPHRDAQLTIDALTEKLFSNNENNVTLIDEGFNRKIAIEKVNSASTMIWNPYKTAIADELTAEDYETFVCIEAANVTENAITLQSGQKHKLTMSIYAERL